MKIFLRTKIVSLKHEIDITNEDKKKIYEVTSRFISIHDKTQLVNCETNKKVAEIHRKPISIHEIYYVEMENGTKFELSTEIFQIVHEKIDIKGLGWQIQGNLLQHDFDLVDENGNTVASSHRKWVTLHEAYEVDVLDDSKLETVIAIYAVIDHIMATREKNAQTTAATTATN